MNILVVCLAILELSGVMGFSAGPPASNSQARDLVCNQLAPSPSAQAHGSGPTQGNGGYQLEISPSMTETTDGFTYVPDTVYTIRVVGTRSTDTFRGFMVQARLPSSIPAAGANGMLVGSFTPEVNSNQQTLNCDDLTGAATQATISHMGALSDVRSVQFTWTAPSMAGDVNFFYTVVRVRVTHFDAISARSVGVLTPSIDPTTTPPPLITLPPGNTVAPQRTPDEYNITLTLPFTGCNRMDCDLFIGIAVNSGDPDFIDIYMEGTAEGWLAVGFSVSDNMFSADVVACNRVGDQIRAIDGWNPSGVRNTVTDTIQDVTLYTATYNTSSRRMYCTVFKRVAPSSEAQDLDLSQPLYLIFARRVPTTTLLDSLISHSTGAANARGVTGNRLRVSTGIGTAEVDVFDTVHRPALIKAHGILMLIAWPLLAVTAILFATFMRPALPNGEWFQVHRALMIASLVVTIVGFILAFVALLGPANTARLSLGHMVIGIIIMALQLINPILGLLRCKPGSEHRWLFNMFHGYMIGYILETLSFINISFGLSVFTSTALYSRTFVGNMAPLWLWVAWCVVQFVIIVTGFIAFSIYACITKESACAPSAVQSFVKSNSDKSNETEMTAPGEKSEPEKQNVPKPPSKDAPLRWTVVAVYIGLSLPVVIAIIVMIAVP